MDTALKHRLTGAVILVLLAVLLLPELLTGSGQTSRARAAADAANGEERSIRIDLTEAASSPAAAAAPEANEPAAVALPVPPSPPVEAEAAPAAPVAPATAVPAAAYYVQIGVFENKASARNLERKLRDKGFKPVVDEIQRSGKTLHRVRVGPEADRASANALRARLETAGHKGSVVK
ncbi:MAG: SPOR domain-containing protein [Gammaproteobacteria bacterium]|nr:SPOR domain-containing protein [Gammaproteobacteria bacterium]